MEALTKVFKKDLEAREATDDEQTLINERVEKGEPAYEEDREGYVPPEDAEVKADELKAKAVELGLEEDATEDEVAAKVKENEGSEGDEEKEAETLKAKAIELGLPEDATAEDIAAKEAEGGEEDEQKTFDKADEQGRSDLIIEKEVDLEAETDEEKKKEIQATIDKWKGTKPEKKEEDLEAEIVSYAKDKDVSEDDAREVIEGRVAVSKKYDNDPKKLAHALRSLGSEYSKEKAAHIETAKALDQAGLNAMASGSIKPEEVFTKGDGSKLTRQEVIDTYRESYPGQTDGKEDDEIYDLSRQSLLRHLQDQRRVTSSNVKTDAKSKRVELMSNLPKDAEPYKDSIKQMLDMMPDGAVAGKGFNLNEIIDVHKGRDTNRLVQEAEKRGFKRGLERRRIVGSHRTPAGSGKTSKGSKDESGKHGLSKENQDKALDFYAGHQIPDARKYELYADIIKNDERLEKKKEDDKKDK